MKVHTENVILNLANPNLNYFDKIQKRIFCVYFICDILFICIHVTYTYIYNKYPKGRKDVSVCR